MRRWIARGGFAVLALLIAGFIVLATWEPFTASPSEAPAGGPYSAEIVRDEWGVPHIHGRRDVDVAYGIAWAHAEDDFSTLQDVVAMTRGRYGAIAGKDGAAVDYTYHLLGARRTAERDYARLPEDVRALLEAYAIGLNRYAEVHPGEIKIDRLFPADGIDIATGFALRQPFFFGLDKVIEPLVAGEDPPPEFGPFLGGAPTAGDPMGPDADENGSNAFAIAPSHSGDGVTRLVSNTHQPWRGPVAWYELVVESDEGWHFAGATFPGAPFPLLGHNEDLGWTNTVNRPDLVDVYKLELDDAGTHYRLDGEWKPLESERILLGVKFGPLTIPVWQTVYRSEHGPVIVNDKGAYAFRYGGIDSIAQLTEYYRLNKAKDYAEWRAALSLQAIPSTNFVYADKAGNIAYHYNASLPERAEGHDWRGILPGDDSSLIWRRLAPFDALPHYLNPASGYLWNSNNTPFAAAGESNLDPAGFAPELGIEMEMTNRARRAQRLFGAIDTVGRSELERIKYDTGWERAGYVARLLDGIAALDVAGDPLLAKAQKLLGEWDFSSDGNGAADALATLVLKEGTRADYNGFPDPDPREQLEFAAHHLMDHFGRLDPPLGELVRLRQGTVDLPYLGGSDTLRAASNWDVAPDGRLSVKHGDSFLMFVEWPKDGPVRSRSIVPFGSATTRTSSPHYADQSALFVTKGLKPVHFERADVLQNAVRRYVVTSDRAAR